MAIVTPSEVVIVYFVVQYWASFQLSLSSFYIILIARCRNIIEEALTLVEHLEHYPYRTVLQVHYCKLYLVYVIRTGRPGRGTSRFKRIN